MTKNTASNTSATYDIGDHVQYQAVGGGNVPNSTTQGEVTDVITDKEKLVFVLMYVSEDF
ncbi:hypothetical protein D9757_015120 [Collybiopsis confluens]|uniref:Hypervirulence associated protein TUDOR domain-containing protein n=1 Tax=Collybiopsis confluens TaxID=2823264 RepID=A0A8H5C8F5_9AGAR|nr:hypothetical protein D9757_015120 [Collybiopsis confluens]